MQIKLQSTAFVNDYKIYTLSFKYSFRLFFNRWQDNILQFPES
jgi:hypothetical protein